MIVAGIVVLALAAVGLTYWFVLRKPAAHQAPVAEVPAPSQSATAVPAEANPEPQANPETQLPPASVGEQPATATPAPENTEVAGGSSASRPARVAKPAAAKPTRGPAYAQAHANAEQSLLASRYLDPPDGSALFWARKAKALGDPGAAQIEQQIFAKQMADITAARQSHSYDQARGQIYQLASSFPDHTELRQMQDDIQQEQQRYTQQMEQQRRQAELATQIKKFPVQHRHGTGESFCTGIITMTPDGVGHYDCSTADSKGRCEHVTFGPGSLKEVRIRGDRSLHVATHQSGNFDFVGTDSNLKDAAAALGPLVKR